jgi:hypothetical protein
MNIFFLHMDPNICAQMHCDKHVIKLILETCQMLCAVWHIIDPEYKLYKPRYKLTHKNHPCTIWARSSIQNYKWLTKLGIELCKEYTYRYGKHHACESIIFEMTNKKPCIANNGFTKPAQAMPDMYKDDDVVEAYRQYYFFEKQHILSWKGKIRKRNIPEWIVRMYNLFE